MSLITILCDSDYNMITWIALNNKVNFRQNYNQ
jgi:hypothetical protein